MLSCPICRTDLVLNKKSYVCQQGHCYDVAKEGYVNLHVVQHKNSHQAGDTPISVQARRRFLSAGFYEPLNTKVSQIVQNMMPKTLLDIGCGEGYYTSCLSHHAQVIGLDIAKIAIIQAAKTYKSHRNITWVVGTGAMLPIKEGCVDLCTSFFSPLPKMPIYEALKSDGYLLVATPAPNHLYALREHLFDVVKPHEPTKVISQLSPQFDLVQAWQLQAPMKLNCQYLSDLMHMTPYAYKATLERKTALQSYESFELVADFCLYLFKKTPI